MPPPIYTPPLTLEQLNQRVMGLAQQLSCCYVRKDEQVTSCCYIEVTYAEAQTLVGNSELSPNKMYKIVDRGDRGIFLTAQTTTKFEPIGKRLMLVPNFQFIDGIAYNGWDRAATYNIGDKVFFMGIVYSNTTGSNDSNNGPLYDNTNWTVISKSSFSNFEYREKMFVVQYDFERDWISRQYDEHGNIFGIPIIRQLDYTFNPVDVSDWAMADYCYDAAVFFNSHANFNFSDNMCDGIWDNALSSILGSDLYLIHGNRHTEGAIYNHFLEEIEIYNNTCKLGINSNFPWPVEGHMHISDNHLPGGIFSNTNVGLIENNMNNGHISFNSNIGGISFNKNNGEITGNSVVGSIEGNVNNGPIISCDSGTDPCSIIGNTNNGNISGTFAADVTDPVVNKS